MIGKLAGIPRFYVDYSVQPNEKFLNGTFPLVILDPGCERDMQTLRTQGVKVLGYTSWAEIADDSRWREKFDATRIQTLGRTDWEGDFVNMLDPEWRDFFVDMIAREVIETCKWDGVYLDTFDGGIDAANNGWVKMDAAIQAGAEMVALLRATYPQAIILPNRGFEQWQADRRFQQAIDGMLIERVQTGEDKEWLMEQIQPVQDAKLSIFSLDYTKNEKRAKEIVKSNKRLGFIPLVTATPSLTPPVVMGYPGMWKKD